MSETNEKLFSSQWYRVAALKPRLRPHINIERQSFGGLTWYVAIDSTTGRSHRLSPAVHHVVTGMNGDRTMETLWLRAHERLGDDAPSQDDCIQILGQMHGADMVICHTPPDFREVVSRGRTQRRKQAIARFKNPLGVRIPLLDPDRFLEKTVSYISPLLTPFGFVLWLLFVGYGIILAGMHYTAFTADFADRVLAADNLFVLWLTFPVVKALHELGHGYAIKRWGGEVHEMGIMFLVFIPVPYVDAAGANSFREKWKRAFVGAAGIMTELPIAVIALMVWIEAEPGIVRAIAYNTVLITGVSTILFNANPLLRYDGYYVLADVAEMPNLGTRANKYVFYLIQRYLFGAKNTVNPVDRPDERWKLFAYAVCAFLYRMLIWVGIILLVASKFFFIGILLSIWAIWLMMGWPIVKGLKYLAKSPSLDGRREKALAITGGVVAGVTLWLFVIPAPLATIVEGVVWTPERAELRAGRSGVIETVSIEPGERVTIGDDIATIEDPIILAEAKVARLQFQEAQLKFRAAVSEDPHLAELLKSEWEASARRLEYAESKVETLKVTASTAGAVIASNTDDMPGKYVERGDLVGFIKGEDGLVIRAAVPENEIALVRRGINRAKVRLASDPDRTYRAIVKRVGPASTRELPNMALSKEGGGRYSLDPAAQGSGRALESFFDIELIAEEIDHQTRIGGRAYIKLELGAEPLASQIYRRARQVFLERLNV
ncbi:MAG: HlyD family efflux transporter periplasmic adaptor subunit [Marinicaulis sp.]|nr:HlyD family efflux transporter periplasmic adaptor subunit [Marinicaulis sp.]NNL89327.1 HlyD family efflux transporter periplasmic adaptor subunit [Marinicaulis sp.]